MGQYEARQSNEPLNMGDLIVSHFLILFSYQNIKFNVGIPSNSWLVIRDWEIDAWYLFRIYETKYAP